MCCKCFLSWWLIFKLCQAEVLNLDVIRFSLCSEAPSSLPILSNSLLLPSWKSYIFGLHWNPQIMSLFLLIHFFRFWSLIILEFLCVSDLCEEEILLFFILCFPQVDSHLFQHHLLSNTSHDLEWIFYYISNSLIFTGLSLDSVFYESDYLFLHWCRAVLISISLQCLFCYLIGQDLCSFF